MKNENISIYNLLNVAKILDESMGSIYDGIGKDKNQLVLSSVSYHKSIINTTLSSLQNNEDCACTVHPAFLIDKTFFNCQEEHFYETTQLKNILNQYASENTVIDSSTTNLINFLSTYQESSIRFDKYYSFYVSNEDFNNFIDHQRGASSGDCAWWCPVGCGSDHGCCSNYSGCCLYVHVACLVHDKMCINCTPRWFCFSRCVPEFS